MPLARRQLYSPIRHLAYAIWLNHDPKQRHMAMFTAYFDAAGHPDSLGKAPALFVSGWVASVEKWLKFETHWLALLEEFHITPPFHMTDFEACVGQYAAFKSDPSAREDFRLKAIRVITRYTNKGFSSGVVLPDLRRMFEEYDVPDLPHQPYAFCGLQACNLLTNWVRNRVKAGTLRRNDKLKIVFEHGDKHKGVFERAVEKKLSIVPIFLKKEACVPFQACDLLAWEHRRWLTGRASASGMKPRARKSIIELTRHLSSDSHTFAQYPELAEECERVGYKKRKAT